MLSTGSKVTGGLMLSIITTGDAELIRRLMTMKIYFSPTPSSQTL